MAGKDNLTLVLHKPKDARLEQTPIPDDIGPDDALIQTLRWDATARRSPSLLPFRINSTGSIHLDLVSITRSPGSASVDPTCITGSEDRSGHSC